MTMMKSTASGESNASIAPAEASFTLSIPHSIHRQPDLTLVEKAVLAFIHKHPACSNQRLAKLLGFKIRGVEALLKRLRAQGLITQRGQGRARSHHLTFEVEPRTECGKNSAVESHTQRRVRVIFDSAQATYDNVVMHREMARTCIAYGDFAHALAHMSEANDCVQKQHLLPPEERQKIVALLAPATIVARALAATAPHLQRLPQRERQGMVVALCRASRETLGRIQQRLDGPGGLNDASELLALPFQQ